MDFDIDSWMKRYLDELKSLFSMGMIDILKDKIQYSQIKKRRSKL